LKHEKREEPDSLPYWDLRVKKCIEYLEKYPTVKMAILAAEEELFFASKVAWISALVSLGRDVNFPRTETWATRKA
jgi:hypothetical protein